MRKIVTIITIATMLFTLAACSKGKTEKTASPSDTVIECFYLISHDKVSDLPSLCEADKVEFPYPSETINALFENDETKEMIAEMEKDIDLEVYNSDEKEDKATVKFKTTSYDFGSLVNDTYNDYLEWLTENMFSEISEEETKKESISIFKNNIKELKKLAKKHGLVGNAYKTVENAYKKAINQADAKDVIFVGGSTFVVADFLSYREKNVHL